MAGTTIDWFKDFGLPVLITVTAAAIIGIPIWLKKRAAKEPDAKPDVVPLEQYKSLAKQSGVTEEKLKRFHDVLKAHDIPPEQFESRVEEMLNREQETLERLEATANVNAETDQLRKEAEEAIREGDTDKAMHLLHQAEARDTQAAVGLDDEADDRRRAASQAAYAQGELAFNRLDYTAAANHLERAAGLLPEADVVGRGEALNRVGVVFFEMAKYPEAEIAFNEARALLEEALPPNDPELATVLNNLAQLYQDTDRPREAEPLMVRALKIHEASLGPNHPSVAIRLNNLAQLYQATDRLTEAEPLLVRALGITEASLGPDHPNTVQFRDNLARLREK